MTMEWLYVVHKYNRMSLCYKNNNMKKLEKHGKTSELMHTTKADPRQPCIQCKWKEHQQN